MEGQGQGVLRATPAPPWSAQASRTEVQNQVYIFSGKVRKWEPNGDPEILKNPPKSSKVHPRVPSGEVFGAASGKALKKYDFRAS